MEAEVKKKGIPKSIYSSQDKLGLMLSRQAQYSDSIIHPRTFTMSELPVSVLDLLAWKGRRPVPAGAMYAHETVRLR